MRLDLQHKVLAEAQGALGRMEADRDHIAPADENEWTRVPAVPSPAAPLLSTALAALPRPVAVVVGGGGVLGAAHVGVGHALEECGFVPDLIVGTSVGALVGAIAAAHPTDAAPWLDSVWSGLRRRAVFPIGHITSGMSVCSDRGLRRLIARSDLPDRIEDLGVPFTAIAMDLGTGEEVPLTHGPLGSALLASAAIPGVLPPVVREGRTLVDGGVISHVPVRTALRAGAASVVVIAAGPEMADPMPATIPRHAATLLTRVGLLRLRHQIERDLREVARQVPTVVVPTGIDTWPAPWDFGHSQRLIATATASASRFLDQLHVDGPGLYRAEKATTVGDAVDAPSPAATTNGSRR
jgi:NTE family protein